MKYINFMRVGTIKYNLPMSGEKIPYLDFQIYHTTIMPDDIFYIIFFFPLSRIQKRNSNRMLSI